MKVRSEDTNIFMGDPTKKRRHEGVNGGNKKAGVNNGSVFAGDMRLKQDKILIKKQQAQKKAMKVLMDAHGREAKVDLGIAESRDRIKLLEDDSNSANKEIQSLEAAMNKLKEDLGIADDSQEQMDLELRMKEKASRRPDSGIDLTEDDKKRLAEMGEPTEYQEHALGYADGINTYRDQIYRNQVEIGALASGITQTNIDRLKSHGMVDAEKEAEAIQTAASKEIVGMLADEAKDHIDEELKKKEEEAKKAAEKKKEEEEKKVEAEKKKEELAGEAQTGESQTVPGDHAVENIQGSDAKQTDIMQELKKILDEEKLLDEDLKGMTMDETV